MHRFLLVGDQEQEEVIRVWESKQGAKQDEISQTQGFFHENVGWKTT